MEGRLINNSPSKNAEEINTVYTCVNCGNTLFTGDKKFEAGCGFPSFWMHYKDGVKQNPLHTYSRSRVQLLCNNCGAHLGHLFSSKHTPNGLRYCINAGAIQPKRA